MKKMIFKISSKGYVGTCKAMNINPIMSKGRTTSLSDRLSKLESGKVLDVSKLTDKGTGAVSIKKPTTSRSTKYSGNVLPIVSADLEHYLMAIDQLPGGRASYMSEIKAFQENMAAGPRSPKKNISVTPKNNQPLTQNFSLTDSAQSTIPIMTVNTSLPIQKTKVSPKIVTSLPKYQPNMPLVIPSSPFPSADIDDSLFNLTGLDIDSSDDDSDYDSDSDGDATEFF